VRILASIDVQALERRVLDAAGRRKLGGLLDPLLILVPTHRLADQLRRRLANELGAVLGVWILTHRGLASRALEFALITPPRLLSTAAALHLLESLLEAHRSPGVEALRERPGGLRMLLATFRELREAGIEPRDLDVLPGAAPAVRTLYAPFVEALARLFAEGWTDEAGLIRAALPELPRFLRQKRIARCLHHGAYELIGVHVELLRAVEAAAAVEFLLPGEIDGAGFGTSRRFADHLTRAFPEAPRQRLPSPPGEPEARRRLLERLRALGEPEDAAPDGEPLLEPALELHSVQGEEAELRAAALRALALHGRDGVPLHEIAIVARSLESYLPYLEGVFHDLGVPFVGSAGRPLRRNPVAAAFFFLLRALARGFERRPVIELLRSGLLRLDDVEIPAGAWRVDLWDRWSRSGRVVGGLEGWRQLPAFVERRWASRGENGDDGDAGARRLEAAAAEREAAEALMRALAALERDQQAWGRRRGFESQLAFVDELLARRLGAPGPEAARGLEALRALLADLAAVPRCRAAAGIAPQTWDAAAIEAIVARFADAAAVPVAASGDGVHVLDLMQARGLRFEALIWIGFHRDVFPRRGRQDLHFDDRARESVWERSGKPLYSKLRAADEERLLFALALASTSKRLVIFHQRADDRGEKRARTRAFRDLAKVFAGRAEAAALLDADAGAPIAREFHSEHPERRDRALAESPRFGICPPSDALVGSVLRGADGIEEGWSALVSFEAPDGSTAALEAVKTLESFALPADRRTRLEALRFDGIVGDGLPSDAVLSPSAVQLLCRCPLAFFLKEVLGIRELDAEAEAHLLEARDIGIAVHAALQEVYAAVAPLLPIDRGGIGAARAAALAALDAVWEKKVGEAMGAARGRLPQLHRILAEKWKRALAEFISDDLRDFSERGVQSLALERELSATLRPPGLEGGQRLEGRVDRVLTLAGGLCVDDYKTSGRLAEWVRPAEVLQAEHAQLPLYQEMLAVSEKATAAAGRLLAVSPGVEPAARAAEIKRWASLRAGFLESIAVAIDLARAGSFPAYPDSSVCGHCHHSGVCRRNLAPTRQRFEGDAELRDFRDIKSKTAREPLLEVVRGGAAPPAEPEPSPPRRRRK
jgi:RecB family exonuclease